MISQPVGAVDVDGLATDVGERLELVEVADAIILLQLLLLIVENYRRLVGLHPFIQKP